MKGLIGIVLMALGFIGFAVTAIKIDNSCKFLIAAGLSLILVGCGVVLVIWKDFIIKKGKATVPQ